MTDDQARQRNQQRQRIHHAAAQTNYILEAFGDELARRQKYSRDLDGLDAVRYYLMQKHNWLPSQVRAMSLDDLQFAVHEEMQGWTLPPEARP